MSDMDLDDFLAHKTGSAGGGKELRKWKDNKASGETPARSVDIVLHRQRGSFASVWVHSLPNLVVLEDKQTKRSVTRVFGRDYVCHENEDTCRKHKRHYWGYDDAPVVERCGICKFGDWLYAQVVEGRLSWVDPVLRFEGDVSEETKVIHAGGFYGVFGSTKLTDVEKAELKEARISPKVSWQENSLVAAKYLFIVAEHQKPDNGLQIAYESSLLGDRMKTLFKEQMEIHGREAGNPMSNPYVIRWKHDPDAEEFGKRYSALAIPRLPISDRLMDLITNGKAPDKSHKTDKHDPRTVRAILERHSLIDVPWDDLFGLGRAEAPAERSHEVRGNPPAREPAPPAEDPKPPTMFGCDECDKPMLATATTCPHCGHKYEVEEEKKPEPPKPTLPKRSTAGKPAAAAPKSVMASAKPAPQPEPDDGIEDLPF